MSQKMARYAPALPVRVAEGWSLERLTPPSRLFGANGLRTGPDGRIYVAQVSGSQISAIDVDTGEIETISPKGGGIVGPDDLAFDEEGNLYATEITEGRVSMLTPDGAVRVVQGDMPVANPITYHQGRLFAGECRPGARIMELDRNGGAPRVLIEDVPMVNAFEVGPDGKLYFPVMGTHEIWRIGLEGGAPEIVAGNLAHPDSVKFDRQGFIVTTQAASGQVLRIDPRTGDRTVLADIAPGLDNLTFVGSRLFVSSVSGQITEIVEPGKIRSLIPDGLQWPLGLAMGEDGALFVADGGFVYTLRPGESPRVAGMFFSPGFPGYTRGVAAAGPGAWIVTTGTGEVAKYWPAMRESQVLARGFDQLYGVAVAPGGAVIVAEYGTGRVLSVDGGAVTELATGLNQPKGVAIDGSGICYVAETGAGRIVKLSGGRAETVIEGLSQPEGIVLRGGLLSIVDVGTKELIQHDIASGTRRTMASHLPVGAPPGITPKILRPFPPLAGAMGPFAGLAAGADDTLYIAGDAEGSVLALRRA